MPSTSKAKRLAERKAAAVVGQGKETSPGPEKKRSKSDNHKPMEVDKQEESTKPKATNSQPEGEEESDDLSVSTAAAGNGANKLSQKFENDLKRQHVEFWDIQFRAGKGTNGVALTRAAVMEIFKLLQEIDSTTLLYKYKQTEETEKDALIKPKSLPSAMNRLQEYFYQLRPKADNSVLYTSIRVGFDDDPSNVMANIRGAGWDSSKLEIRIYRKTLQTAFTVNPCWLLFSIQYADWNDWKEDLEDLINTLLARDLKKDWSELTEEEQIRIGLRWKAVWGGLTKADQKKQGGGSNIVKAIHVEFKKGEDDMGVRYLRQALKSSHIRNKSNMAIRLIPVINKDISRYEREKVKECRNIQAKFLASTTSGFTTRFVAIDRKMKDIPKPNATSKEKALAGATLRDLILSVKSDKTKEKLFMYVEASGTGFNIYYPKAWATEAQEKISYLGAYLRRDFGDKALYYFTPRAQEEALSTEWHPITGQPITTTGKDLDETTQAADKYSWLKAEAVFDLEEAGARGDRGADLEGNMITLQGDVGVGFSVNVAANSRAMTISKDSRGLDLEKVAEMLDNENAPEFDLDDVTATLKADVNPLRVVVDCTNSEDVGDYYERWLSMGVSIITPGRKVGSGDIDRYRRVCEAQKQHSTHLYLESSVGNALPILSTLDDLIETGDTIKRIEGALSGTMAFVLSTMSEETPFSEAIRNAVDRDIPEKDLVVDLSGLDTARKVVILARQAGLDVSLDDVAIENILPEAIQNKLYENNDQVIEDVQKMMNGPMLERHKAARAAGGRLRYKFVIDVENKKCKCWLDTVQETDPLFRLKRNENLVAFDTLRYQQSPLIVKGAAAGPDLSAAGIFADLLRFTRAYSSNQG